MPAPEQEARDLIDRLLEAAGWAVCDVKDASGVAIREFPLESGYGFADHLLYVDARAAGVIAAKKWGIPLRGVEPQSGRYAQGLPAALPAWWRPLPAIPNKARAPCLDDPYRSGPLRIVRFCERALTEGIEEHLIDGVPVRITNLARTVADCFKYRNKIGLDVALEALTDVLKERSGQGGRGHRARIDDLWRHAWLNRVANVMRPYIEALA